MANLGTAKKNRNTVTKTRVGLGSYLDSNDQSAVAVIIQSWDSDEALGDSDQQHRHAPTRQRVVSDITEGDVQAKRGARGDHPSDHKPIEFAYNHSGRNVVARTLTKLY